jgi:hypothetical protein
MLKYNIFTYKYYPPTPHQAPNPNNYGRALLSALPQAIAPNPHTNFQNVYIHFANKIGFQKKKDCMKWACNGEVVSIHFEVSFFCRLFYDAPTAVFLGF